MVYHAFGILTTVGSGISIVTGANEKWKSSPSEAAKILDMCDNALTEFKLLREQIENNVKQIILHKEPSEQEEPIEQEAPTEQQATKPQEAIGQEY